MPGPWGKAIEKLRLERRLTRATVAKRARMTATTYGRIERGHHTLTRQLQDIADVFGVPIEDVLHIPHGGYGFASRTPDPGGGVNPHAQGVGVLTPNATPEIREMRELQAQVGLLQHQLAEIVAEQEAQRRQRSQRLPKTGTRKSGGAPHARKSR